MQLANGPLWWLYMNYGINCEQNWWASLLYIQNYYNAEAICLAHTWYLSVSRYYHTFDMNEMNWTTDIHHRLSLNRWTCNYSYSHHFWLICCIVWEICLSLWLWLWWLYRSVGLIGYSCIFHCFSNYRVSSKMNVNISKWFIFSTQNNSQKQNMIPCFLTQFEYNSSAMMYKRFSSRHTIQHTFDWCRGCLAVHLLIIWTKHKQHDQSGQ